MLDHVPRPCVHQDAVTWSNQERGGFLWQQGHSGLNLYKVALTGFLWKPLPTVDSTSEFKFPAHLLSPPLEVWQKMRPEVEEEGNEMAWMMEKNFIDSTPPKNPASRLSPHYSAGKIVGWAAFQASKRPVWTAPPTAHRTPCTWLHSSCLLEAKKLRFPSVFVSFTAFCSSLIFLKYLGGSLLRTAVSHFFNSPWTLYLSSSYKDWKYSCFISKDSSMFTWCWEGSSAPAGGSC